MGGQHILCASDVLRDAEYCSDPDVEDLAGAIRQWTLLAYMYRHRNIDYCFFLLLAHHRFKSLFGNGPALFYIPRHKGRQFELAYA